MCGFLGGVLRRPVESADVRAFRRGIRMLAHRGPDAETLGVIPEVNAVLAFRRLSIIDHATGGQPMTTGAGQHILFNGEIYNYKEVRAEMEREGVAFRTHHSDTEVLLRKVVREGLPGLSQLAGMFAFAILDTEAHTLLLGRDRLGIKQLYYTDTEQGFFFASEPKALLALPWVAPGLDQTQLPAYFNFRSTPAPNTLLRGVRKLAAGTALRLDLRSGHHSIERYWSVPATAPAEGTIPAAEALDRFEASFLQAIRRRLVADVPVGAFLSGGLDSSLVVAGMAKLGHPRIETFSAAFPGSPDDEAAFARRVSQRFGTKHFEHQENARAFADALPGWVELNDDLVADASCLPLLAVARMARNAGVIVLLSGEGADELFAGYGSYHKYVGLRRLRRMLPGTAARRAALRLLGASGKLAGQDVPRATEYLVRGGGFLGTAALLGEVELGLLLPGFHQPMPRAKGHDLADLCAFDFVTRIPEDLMVRTDRATMGASVEARVPFLDHDLVETTFALPHALRATPGASKVLLRSLARRWGVPRETIAHRKIGFQLPIGDWFRQELRPLWNHIFDERVIPGIDYDHVRRILALHERGLGHFEELLWRVAALELWYRRWVCGDSGNLGLLPGAEPDRDTVLSA